MILRVTTNNENCRAVASRSFDNLRLFSKELLMTLRVTTGDENGGERE